MQCIKSHVCASNCFSSVNVCLCHDLFCFLCQIYQTFHLGLILNLSFFFFYPKYIFFHHGLRGFLLYQWLTSWISSAYQTVPLLCFLKRGKIQRTKVMKILLSQVIWPNSPRRVSSSTPNGSSLYLCGFLRFTLSYNLCAHIAKITTFSFRTEVLERGGNI